MLHLVENRLSINSAASVHTFSTARLGILLPFSRRLVLSAVVTGAILQQSALL